MSWFTQRFAKYTTDTHLNIGMAECGVGVGVGGGGDTIYFVGVIAQGEYIKESIPVNDIWMICQVFDSIVLIHPTIC